MPARSAPDDSPKVRVNTTPSVIAARTSIVCPTDFSEEGFAAAQAASALAARLRDAEVWVVHAVDLTRPELAGLSLAETRQQADAQLAALLHRLAPAPGLRIRTNVVYGSVVDATLAFANDHRAQLLVVAAHGAGGSSKLGSTAEQMAQRAMMPLLLVRSGEPFKAWSDRQRPLKLMLGADHSTNWLACLGWVRELHSAAHCSVEVAQIFYANEERRRCGLPEIHDLATSDPDIEKLLTRDLQARVGDMPGSAVVSFRPYRGIGRKGDHLVQLSNSERVDVLVVGTHRPSGLSRLTSVTWIAMHDCEASVLIVPPNTNPPLPHRAPHTILVAVDGSVAAQEATMAAYALLEGRSSGRVVLLHVVEDSSQLDTAPDFDSVLEETIPQGWRTATRIETVFGSDVAGAICKAAERHGVDVICMGSRGRSGVARTLLGSTSDRVLKTTTRPVMVVKAPEE